MVLPTAILMLNLNKKLKWYKITQQQQQQQKVEQNKIQNKQTRIPESIDVLDIRFAGHVIGHFRTYTHFIPYLEDFTSGLSLHNSGSQPPNNAFAHVS